LPAGVGFALPGGLSPAGAGFALPGGRYFFLKRSNQENPASSGLAFDQSRDYTALKRALNWTVLCP